MYPITFLKNTFLYHRLVEICRVSTQLRKKLRTLRKVPTIVYLTISQNFLSVKLVRFLELVPFRKTTNSRPKLFTNYRLQQLSVLKVNMTKYLFKKQCHEWLFLGLKISGGAVVGDPPTNVFVSTGDYSLQNSLYTGSVVTSHKDNKVIPFFTDYPFVTMMDRPSTVEPIGKIGVKESFFIKYILKPQPMSTGKYYLTFKPGEKFKVNFEIPRIFDLFEISARLFKSNLSSLKQSYPVF